MTKPKNKKSVPTNQFPHTLVNITYPCKTVMTQEQAPCYTQM